VEREDTTEIFFLVSGTVEYVTEIDGNDFVLKTLEAGSIINYTNVIIDDLMYVNIRCVTNVKLIVLSNEKLLQISEMFPKMNSKVNSAWNKANAHGNKFALDFIQHD